MSDPQVSKNGSFRAASLRDNLIAAMSIVALLLAIAAELPSTIANTAQWITTREVASNAAVKQHGEAVALYEQAKTELEVARNAGERMKAEADQLSAEADQLEAMGKSAQAEAQNARVKAKADADTMVARAALNGQKSRAAASFPRAWIGQSRRLAGIK